jgi:hypothetical protein
MVVVVEKGKLCLLMMRMYVPGKRRLRGSVKEKDFAYVTFLRNIKMRHQSLCFHVQALDPHLRCLVTACQGLCPLDPLVHMFNPSSGIHL